MTVMEKIALRHIAEVKGKWSRPLLSAKDAFWLRLTNIYRFAVTFPEILLVADPGGGLKSNVSRRSKFPLRSQQFQLSEAVSVNWVKHEFCGAKISST